ncbi:MAG: HAD-IA family hydrolase [Candidatus Omnitrophica bacterium]|nr:HAD-IA family hydrolase [Candidatus Omnitrophota bacterium]
MMIRKIKAVIFDMDGVITNTMPYHYQVWREIFHAEGIPVSKYEVYSREGQKGLNSVLEIFAKYGKKISLKEAKELLAKKENAFKKAAKTRFIPGSRSFIKKIHHQGFRLALVTGTSSHEINEILPAKLRDLFDVIVSGSDVTHGKPHPEPYQRALKALRITPQEAIVIENAPFGITSATKAGIFCIAMKTSLPASYLKKANTIVSDYHQLERYAHGSIGLKKS